MKTTLVVLIVALLVSGEAKAEQRKLKLPADILITSQYDGVHKRPPTTPCGSYFLVVEKSAEPGCGSTNDETFVIFYVHQGERVVPLTVSLSTFKVEKGDESKGPRLLGESVEKDRVVISLPPSVAEKATCFLKAEKPVAEVESPVTMKLPTRLFATREFRGTSAYPKGDVYECGPYFLAEDATDGSGSSETLITFYVNKKRKDVLSVRRYRENIVVRLEEVKKHPHLTQDLRGRTTVLLSEPQFRQAKCLPSPEGGEASEPKRDRQSPRYASGFTKEK